MISLVSVKRYKFNMHYSVVRATNIYLQERKKIVDSIFSHALALEKECEELVKEIEVEISEHEVIFGYHLVLSAIYYLVLLFRNLA